MSTTKCLRVKALSAAIDELCNQGWDEWENAKEELDGLLEIFKHFEDKIEVCNQIEELESKKQGTKRQREEDDNKWKEYFHGLLADMKEGNEHNLDGWATFADQQLLEEVIKEQISWGKWKDF